MEQNIDSRNTSKHISMCFSTKLQKQFSRRRLPILVNGFKTSRYSSKTSGWRHNGILQNRKKNKEKKKKWKDIILIYTSLYLMQKLTQMDLRPNG